MAARYAKVSTDLALNRTFTYRIPEALQNGVSIGSVVYVPFGRSRKRAYVLDVLDTPDYPAEKIKDVDSLSPAPPLFDAGTLALARWMAAYYLAPLEHAIAAVLPAAVRREGAGFRKQWIARLTAAGREISPEELVRLQKKSPKQAAALHLLKTRGDIPAAELCREINTAMGSLHTMEKHDWLTLEKGVLLRKPADHHRLLPVPPYPLMPGQRNALDAILAEMQKANPRPILLHGVTGSGKTEVYLHAIQNTLDAGKGAIALVPEISLTPQAMERFRGRFGEEVAVLHSRLSDGERHDEWQRIAAGKARVVIGARSALFAPVRPLGLIIVDEEHEPAYKQEESPRYHARDVAVMRAHLEKCVVVLGSATPSLESYHNAKTGRYHLVEMPVRVDDRKLPTVYLVDMRKEVDSTTDAMRYFSQPLADAIRNRLALGEQTLIFLNRRGYATALTCNTCGESVTCLDCSVHMTYHRATHCLMCHICGATASVPADCPSCHAPIKPIGIGTQRIESALARLFPFARIARMDSDTTSRKDAHDNILAAFRRGETDILIGTQMIAKGLDFPRVTLVGVINADAALQMPDFRATERTFQLLAQVAGRSGRGEVPGEVVFQTRAPGHTVLQAARNEDYAAFYEEEAEARRVFGYPPFTSLSRILFHGPDEAAVEQAAAAFADAIRPALPPGFRLNGPAWAPISKIKSNYRNHLLLRAPLAARATLTKLIRRQLALLPPPKNVHCTITVDAISLL